MAVEDAVRSNKVDMLADNAFVADVMASKSLDRVVVDRNDMAVVALIHLMKIFQSRSRRII